MPGEGIGGILCGMGWCERILCSREWCEVCLVDREDEICLEVLEKTKELNLLKVPKTKRSVSWKVYDNDVVMFMNISDQAPVGYPWCSLEPH